MQTVMENQVRLTVLLKRAQEGDSGAFESLVDQCRAELEKYVGSRIGDHLKIRVESEDVLQETYVRAWETLKRLEWTGRDTFIRWLKGIARHVILQQASRKPHSELVYVEKSRSSCEPTPSKVLRREERFDRLQDAVNHLPPDYREAIVLVRIQGLRISQAAEQMKRSPKAVTHLLSRALKQLKEILADTESLRLPPRHLNRDEANEH